MRLTCWYCKKSCSSELPSGTIIRAIAICPECIEKNIPEKEAIKEFSKKVEEVLADKMCISDNHTFCAGFETGLQKAIDVIQINLKEYEEGK